ncbi:MAG: hypothetical protein WC522_07535 [Candidatus Omnitrophota bacterium]
MTKKESRKILMDIHEKHYGKNGSIKNKKAKKTAEDRKIAEAVSPVLANKSRNDLMLEAKAKGIKNFRILNKAELYKVLDPATIQQEIDGIVSDAVIRWKSGWSKNKTAGKKEEGQK